MRLDASLSWLFSSFCCHNLPLTLSVLLPSLAGGPGTELRLLQLVRSEKPN